jgi:23S rRNA (cytidine1920-2'-O)/16S rRNA (cytidine1409-2'-O)-methyltransferase
MQDPPRYISRGGEKLRYALDHAGLSCRDVTAADLGANVGGFTDCLLQAGAARVYAVDTGYGVLDWHLRNDPRVVVMERTNALHVSLPEPVDLVVSDVAWTRQRHIVPHALSLLRAGGTLLSLFKPQYEAPRRLLTKGILPAEQLEPVLRAALEELDALGLPAPTVIPLPPSPPRNRELFLLFRLD